MVGKKNRCWSFLEITVLRHISLKNVYNEVSYIVDIMAIPGREFLIFGRGGGVAALRLNLEIFSKRTKHFDQTLLKYKPKVKKKI